VAFANTDLKVVILPDLEGISPVNGYGAKNVMVDFGLTRQLTELDGLGAST
jgi:hypothetical protein